MWWSRPAGPRKSTRRGRATRWWPSLCPRSFRLGRGVELDRIAFRISDEIGRVGDHLAHRYALRLQVVAERLGVRHVEDQAAHGVGTLGPVGRGEQRQD